LDVENEWPMLPRAPHHISRQLESGSFTDQLLPSKSMTCRQSSCETSSQTPGLMSFAYPLQALPTGVHAVVTTKLGRVASILIKLAKRLEAR